MYLCIPFFDAADVAKLVDALDLGSSAARLGGSSPFIRTKHKPSMAFRKAKLRVLLYFTHLNIICLGHSIREKFKHRRLN